MISPHADNHDYHYPLHGAHDPSSRRQGTSPGSFAAAADIGGPLAFSSPDTPGMPPPSPHSAWDFNPSPRPQATAVTQLEKARLGIVTQEMRRVAKR
ncbi:MAG: thiamine biosynthesis protein ThiC, partial [Planctomycetota bacterium]